ncbi:hypothetical protein E8E13_002667 [Curvularia kusanoi]|uniref:non-specific serine/threonine protein kinase n=1 Tax=Curvularia kusanoi TaxID=90978 RepID=A0A9P4TBN7_CURKU|nr:hypothetical protein E8E13_002667 [Curvularia kusanoi]
MAHIDPARSSNLALPSTAEENLGKIIHNQKSPSYRLTNAILLRIFPNVRLHFLTTGQQLEGFDALFEAVLNILEDYLRTTAALLRLDDVIRDVTVEITTFGPEIRQKFTSDVDADAIRLDVAVEVYLYALKHDVLQHLVPNGMFTDGEMTKSEWILHLYSRGLLPNEAEALDWSGRGQHAEYLPDEEQLIPLVEGKVLGHSMSAVVQSVQCRRIQLARKTIRCNRRFTKQMAVMEVAHLRRVQHRHIIRLVGTYTFKRDLAILLYPVATWNLDEFLEEYIHNPPKARNKLTIWRFFGCLAGAMACIHAQNVKHMDIKPGNILVRRSEDAYRVYIADFGIARAYKSAEASNTDSPTSFTPIYAAPEVITQDKRGYPADIFSLGCVFLEIVEAIMHAHLCPPRRSLSALRIGNRSYSANLKSVHEWCDEVHTISGLRPAVTFSWMSTIKEMLYVDPQARPAADAMSMQWSFVGCRTCHHGPEPFSATPPPPPGKKDTSFYPQE